MYKISTTEIVGNEDVKYRSGIEESIITETGEWSYAYGTDTDRLQKELHGKYYLINRNREDLVMLEKEIVQSVISKRTSVENRWKVKAV